MAEPVGVEPLTPSESSPATGAGFWARVVATSGAQIYGTIASTLSLVLTARWLGPAGRGQVVAAAGWASTFATLGHLSLGQVAAYTLGDRERASVSDRELGRIFGTLLGAAAVIVMGSWLFGLALVLRQSPWLGALPGTVLAAGLLMVPGLVLEQYVNGLLLARNRIAVLNTGQVAGRTLLLVLLVLLWWVGAGVGPVLIAMAAAQMGVVAIGASALWREARGRLEFSLVTLGHLLRGGMQLHLNFVGDFLMSSAGILLLNAHASGAETAFYQLGVQLVSVLAILPQTASLLYVPHVVKLGPRDGWRYQRATLVSLLAVVVLCSVAAAVVVPLVLPLLVGRDFSGAIPVFWWLLLTVPVMALSRAMAPQWLSRGLYLQVALITLGAGVVNVGAATVLIPRSGSVGAAQALVWAYVPVLLAQAAMFVHCERARMASDAP